MPERVPAAVLGANGFVGNRLCEHLKLAGLAEVRPIVRTYKGLARLARFDLDCRVADARDRAALQAELTGCDVLFHCVVGDRDTILRSAESAYEAAAGAGVKRLVYLSSAVVHGHDPAPGTDETGEPRTKQSFEYNVSKAMAEFRLRQLRQDGRVEVSMLRPYIVFGPRSQWWTAKIAEDLIAGRAYLVDGGSGICNTVYVDNLVHAMWLAAVNPNAANQDFLIGDAETVTWRQLYAVIASAVGADIGAVTSVQAGEAQAHFQRQKRAEWVGALKRSRLGRTLKEWIPGHARAWIKREAEGPPSPSGPASPAPIATAAPILDREIVSLQQCRWQLPSAKAERLLGYHPPVSFPEAGERSAAWLRFALGRLP